MQTFLISGTPLDRLSHFRSVLEQGSLYALTDASHMAATYIPLIEDREVRMLQSEMNGQYFSISFDGTTRYGEAVNVTGRYCTASFKIETRLLRFVTTKLHLASRQLSSLITKIICTDLRLDPAMLVRSPSPACSPLVCA